MAVLLWCVILWLNAVRTVLQHGMKGVIMQNSHQYPGTFITFEGIDGSGKSTHARRLHEQLTAVGRSARITREPGGSTGAEEIRSLILQGAGERWSAETETLLFKAARRDHLERVIWPALERGEIVVCDRFADSTRAYQGATREGKAKNLRALVDTLHELVVGHEPDLTLIIDVDPAEAARRFSARMSADELAAKESRFERMGDNFQQDLHQAYQSLATEPAHQRRCVLIDGLGTEDEVFNRVWQVVTDRLSIVGV